MITKKKITIPIFGYKLTIIIFDEMSDLHGQIPEHHIYGDFRGLAYGEDFSGVVCIGSKYGSTIAHESLHMVNAVWKAIGYEPQRDNDEVSAYLLTYIYEKIVDVFYLHNDKKPK